MLDKIMAVYMTAVIALGSFLGIGGYSKKYEVFDRHWLKNF